MNLLYDPEYHNTGQYHKDMGARDERKEIVAWLRSLSEEENGHMPGTLANLIEAKMHKL